MRAIDYRALRAAVSLQQVLDLLRFKPTRCHGRKVRGHCPLHDPAQKGHRRCFSADLDGNRFYCFRCGKGGNQLDLWSLSQGLAIYPAAIDLCRHLHIEPLLITAPSAPSNKRHHVTANSPRPATG